MGTTMKKLFKQLIVMVLAITMLLPSNIIYAAGQSSYQINSVITRAEFVAMINNQLGLTKQDKKNFSDVKSTDWYYADLAIAKKAGYLLSSNNKAYPNYKLTNSAAASMLVKAFKVTLEGDEVKTLQGLDVLSSDPSFNVKATVTKAQAIDYINKLVDALKTPKYVFYLIGDGMGASHRALTEYYQQYVTKNPSYKLAMNQLPVASIVTTYSSDSLVTDSAAAGTALSTGHKTNSGVVAMDPTGKVAYKTILEAAKEKGMATGLITSVTITHATPASFGAHIASRDDQAGIALQYLTSDINYFAGGGLKYFLPKSQGGSRVDEKDLTKAFEEKGYTVLTSRGQFESTDFKKTDKVLGLYAKEYFDDEINQVNAPTRSTPELYELLQSGIQVLSQDKDGFFIMCEGGKIDESAHFNDTASVIHETLAFDKAVKVAFDFYKKHPNETLIVVGADHETGGLSLSNNDYMLNMKPLTEIKSSVTASIISAWQKDPKSIYSAIEKNWNIKLTDADRAYVDQRMEESRLITIELLRPAFPPGTPDSQIIPLANNFMFNFTGWAIAPLLAKQTSITWGTQTHTAETVPFTSVGVHADWLNGYKDNTDIAKTIAKIMGVQLD